MIMTEYRTEKQNTRQSSAASVVGVGAMSSISRRLRFFSEERDQTCLLFPQRLLWTAHPTTNIS